MIQFGVGVPVFLVVFHCHSGPTLARGAAFGRAHVCLGVGFPVFFGGFSLPKLNPKEILRTFKP